MSKKSLQKGHSDTTTENTWAQRGSHCRVTTSHTLRVWHSYHCPCVLWMSASLRLHILRLNSHWGGIWRWGLWEVISS